MVLALVVALAGCLAVGAMIYIVSLNHHLRSAPGATPAALPNTDRGPPARPLTV